MIRLVYFLVVVVCLVLCSWFVFRFGVSGCWFVLICLCWVGRLLVVMNWYCWLGSIDLLVGFCW